VNIADHATITCECGNDRFELTCFEKVIKPLTLRYHGITAYCSSCGKRKMLYNLKDCVHTKLPINDFTYKNKAYRLKSPILMDIELIENEGVLLFIAANEKYGMISVGSTIDEAMKDAKIEFAMIFTVYTTQPDEMLHVNAIKYRTELLELVEEINQP
jgi:hypothetical protein